MNMHDNMLEGYLEGMVDLSDLMVKQQAKQLIVGWLLSSITTSILTRVSTCTTSHGISLEELESTLWIDV